MNVVQNVKKTHHLEKKQLKKIQSDVSCQEDIRRKLDVYVIIAHQLTYISGNKPSGINDTM